jgi:hypothetical protein
MNLYIGNFCNINYAKRSEISNTFSRQNSLARMVKVWLAKRNGGCTNATSLVGMVKGLVAKRDYHKVFT